MQQVNIVRQGSKYKNYISLSDNREAFLHREP